MLSKLLAALFLMSLCVTLHALGIATVLRWSKGWFAPARASFWSATRMLIQVAAWAVLFHLLEIALWGVFYAWTGGMPDFSSAVYFSAVTYTTTGYGDLVLSPEWRMVGTVEALTGILMCGWSTGFFFAIVSGIHKAQTVQPHSDAGEAPTGA